MAGLIVSAGIVSGQLILGLDSGELITVGYVQGPQGLTGPAGPHGPKGKDGIDGNTVLHSAGRPKPEMGVDGDHHVNTVDWEWSIKESGKWGKGQPLLADRANPTGGVTHKDRWKAGGGRFFPMGGVSAAVSVPGGGGGGTLQPILQNDVAVPANTPSVVAVDQQGDAMIVDLWAQAAQGTLFVEVAVSKGNGTDTGYSSVYEVQMGTAPPVLTFTPSVTGTGGLQLSISSNLALTTLRGRVLLL